MHRLANSALVLAITSVCGATFAQPAAPAAAPASAPAAAPAPAEAPGPAAAATPAAASEATKEAGEEPFGKAGVINVGSDLSLNVQHIGYSAPSGRSAPSSVTTYAIGPAADYFVIDNLSVGAMVLFGRTQSPDSEAKIDTIAFEPRVGYHIPLVPEKLGLWPKVSFYYEHEKLTAEGSPDLTGKRMGVGAFVPLLIHPVEHFHFGVGPYITTDLSAKEEDLDAPKATTIGLRLEISGWWKL